jgi:hypothetical protein
MFETRAKETSCLRYMCWGPAPASPSSWGDLPRWGPPPPEAVAVPLSELTPRCWPQEHSPCFLFCSPSLSSIFECRERESLLGKSSDSESPTPVDPRGSPFLSNDAFVATNRKMNIMTGSTCDDPTAGKGIGELGIVSDIFV